MKLGALVSGNSQKAFLANFFFFFLVGGLFTVVSFTISFSSVVINFELFPNALGYLLFAVGFYYLYLVKEIFQSFYGVIFWLFGACLFVSVSLAALISFGFEWNVISYDTLLYLSSDLAFLSLGILAYGIAKRYLKNLVNLWSGVLVLGVLNLLVNVVFLVDMGSVLDFYRFFEQVLNSADWFWLVFLGLFAVFAFLILVFIKTILSLKSKKDRYGKFFAVIALLYFSYLIFSYGYMLKLDEQEKLFACQELAGSTGGDDCFGAMGSEYGNLNYCDKIVDQLKKDNCLVVIGQEGANPDVCSWVVNQVPRDICYLNVADNISDSKVCENVADEAMRAQCSENAK